METPVEKFERRTATEPPPVITISRITFNYIVIAVSFLLLGTIMGAIGYERLAQGNLEENQRLIANAVTQIQAAIEQSAASGGQEAEARPRLDPNERYDILVGDNPSLGPESAPVTIVEFADFRCGFCGRFAHETLQPLLNAYEGKIRFVYRDFIIFGQLSYEAALAAECAEDQGAFWQFHNLVYANQQDLSRDKFIEFAGELDLDTDAFTTCFDDQTHRQNITDDVTYGDGLGISGTPTFFINGRLVSGAQPYEVFAGIIDEELAAANAPESMLESGA